MVFVHCLFGTKKMTHCLTLSQPRIPLKAALNPQVFQIRFENLFSPHLVWKREIGQNPMKGTRPEHQVEYFFTFLFGFLRVPESAESSSCVRRPEAARRGSSPSISSRCTASIVANGSTSLMGSECAVPIQARQPRLSESIS